MQSIYNIYQPSFPQITHNIIEPVAGANPIDASAQRLNNVRGRLRVIITSKDNNYTSSFLVVGGYGQDRSASTQNFYVIYNTAVGGTVTSPALNYFTMQTDVADAGGRTYVVRFFPVQSVGPTIQQTSVNTIGNFDVDVVFEKYVYLC